MLSSAATHNVLLSASVMLFGGAGAFVNPAKAPTDSMVANITPYLQASIVTASSRECQPPFGVDACATAS